MDALTAAATAVSHRHQSANLDLFSAGVSARPALESRLMQYPSGPRPLPVNCGLQGPGQSPVGIDLRSIPASFSRSPPSSRGTESQAPVPAAGPQCPSLPVHGCTSPTALYDNRGQGFFANHHPGSGGGQNLNLRLPASPDSADVPVFYHPPPPPPPSAFLSNVVSAESTAGLMDTAGGVSMATAMEAWRALTAVHQSAAVAAALAAGYGQCHESSLSLPFGYQHYANSYGGIDVRRKNATRESTSTLKAWLYEHIKNPYPTKGEKIMLAIVTRMTLTQVSTWFANARRRLKKENKMQWSPRNRTGDDDDDDDDVIDDDDLLLEDNNYCNHSSNNNDSSTSSADCAKGGNGDSDKTDHHHDDNRLSVEYVVRAAAAVAAAAAAGRNSGFEVEERFHSHADRVNCGGQSADDEDDDVIVDVDNDDIDDTRPSVANQKLRTIGNDLAMSSNPEVISEQREPSRPDVAKPRIWSLADVATSGTKTNDGEAITTQSPLFASLWSSFHQRRSPSLAMNNFTPWNAGISGCRIPAAAPPPLLPLSNPKEASSLSTLNGFQRPVVSPPFPVRTASGVPDTERTVSPPLSCRSSLSTEDRCLKGFVGVSASDIIRHRR